MTLQIVQRVRKPLLVDAVQVTDENFDEVAKWCEGFVNSVSRQGDVKAKYVGVHVLSPGNIRQTRAFVGDWVLRSGTTFKVYTSNAFTKTFYEAPPSSP